MGQLTKIYLGYYYIILLIVFSVILTYCSDSGTNPDDKDTAPVVEGYNLVWNDEFEGSSIDLNKWVHEVNGNPDNNELQYYSPRVENSYVNNGSLYIVARREQFTGTDGTRDYTSARMTTQNTQTFQYGKVTARMKLPFGQGLWPAFWMLGSNINQVSWPECGEIDIMEMIGGGNGRDNVTHATLHWDNNGYQSLTQSFALGDGIFNNDFHEFTINWDSEKIEWLLDDQIFFTLPITDASMSEFHQPFFIIFNVAVGGNWPGAPNPQTVFPQEMVVDYVRVYQKTD